MTIKPELNEEMQGLILAKWLTGHTFEQIGLLYNMTADDVRATIWLVKTTLEGMLKNHNRS